MDHCINTNHSSNQSLLPSRLEMDKFFVLSLLGMLIVACGVSGSIEPDGDIDMIRELENFDIGGEDDDVVDASAVPVWRSERGSKVLMNVDSFNAVGDGVSDDTMVHRHFCLEIWIFAGRIVNQSVHIL